MKNILFLSFIFLPFYSIAQSIEHGTKKCIQVKKFIKYRGDKEVTIKKPMCACYDEIHHNFEIKSKAEITLSFQAVDYQVMKDEANYKWAIFNRQTYGGQIGNETCDVSIIETPEYKTFMINFSQKHYGYSLSAKEYSDDMPPEPSIPLK